MSGRVRTSGRNRQLAVALAALLAVAFAVVAPAGLAGDAAAGDNVAVVEFDPDEREVEPGETVAVDVTLRSHGEYGDAGVRRLVLRVDYPTEYLAVTDVEAGDWFHHAPDGDPRGEGDGEIEVRESVDADDDRGAVRVEQSLANPDDGVTGTATVATFTFEVGEDAEAASVELDAAESEVHLTSRYPQPLSTTAATLHVDGGGDVVSPEHDDEAFADRTDPSAGDGGGDAADADGGTVDAGSGDATGGDGADGENGDDGAKADDAGTDGDEGGGDDADGGASVGVPATGDAAAPVAAVATALGAVAATLLLRRR